MKLRMFDQYIKLAWQNLTHRKKRAWLTIIGVFIGIMAVIALVSLGQGLQKGVNAEFEKLGVDKIFIQPQSAFGGVENSARQLSDNDIRRVQGVQGVKQALGVQYHSATMDWGDEVAFPIVTGYSTNKDTQALFAQSLQVDIDQGRAIQSSDTYRAVIGVDYTDRTKYKKPLQLGSHFTLNGKEFTVVGIRQKVGNAADDSEVFIPDKVFDEIVPSSTGEYGIIIAQAEAGVKTADLAISIKHAIAREHNVKDGNEDFTVQTSDDLMRTAGQVIGILQTVLTGIACISLIVGAVGITNTMYTAVLERRKEIGIMKAVGATNEAILVIFMAESGLLGLFGGFIGVVLGLAISFGTASIAGGALGTNLVQAYVSWWLVLGGLFFGFVIGALAGTLPAKQATQMKPVDTLRYE